MNSKSVLRQLLRAVDRHITSVAGNQVWRKHVISQFRANTHIENSVRQQQLLLLAKEYAELVANIAHYQELLQRYNIGVDPDDRNKEMVAKTAARVGFELPRSGEEIEVQSQRQPSQQQQQQHQVQQGQDFSLQQEPQQQEEQAQAQQQGQRQEEQVHQEVVPAMAYARRLQGVQKVPG